MIFLPLALTLSAPGAAVCTRGSCSVPDMLAHRAALVGRTVRVRGWLRGCDGGFVCQLDAHAGADATATLGYVARLERRLGSLDGAEIVLRARVARPCSEEDICTDRVPTLIPLGIVRVLTRPAASAKRID